MMKKTHNIFVLLTIAACAALGIAFVNITEAENELRKDNVSFPKENIADEIQISDSEHVLNLDAVSEEPHVHTEANKVVIEKTDPTCTEEGHTTTAVVCDCRTELRHESETIPPLGHDYDQNTGFCTRCGLKDPEFVKVYSSKEIVQALKDSRITDSGTTAYHLGSNDRVNVFGKERENCITTNTSATVNLWNGSHQYYMVNLTSLSDIDTLHFKVCGENGTTGSMTVEFYLDPESLDDEEPYLVLELDPIALEKEVSLPIKDTAVLAVKVDNHAGHSNRVVFYDFTN
ncbi:MAG: hypothetical protein IKG46_13865 [Solobacterium sp.]|nr:hypothetical protein [Solobacterium sp.]MBR3358901.1 hypothetical protein [Solobacterium sp.]